MKKVKLTLIDVLIIAAIILVCAAGALMLKKSRSGSVNTKHVIYTVLVADQTPAVAESIVADDRVLLDPTDEAYGSVSNVEIKLAENSYFSAFEGKFVSQTTEERKDVYLTVEADATENDWGYDIGKQHIRVGEKQSVSGGGYGVSGYIVDVAQ